jgi:hypothetical protein
VPGAFVHYGEKCAACGIQFLRITHLLIGHPRRPKAFPANVVSDDWSWYEPVLAEAEALSKKTKLPLGPLVGNTGSFASMIRAYQTCPGCGEKASDPLISNDEAISFWPGRDEHFQFRLPLPGKGWNAATPGEKRLLADASEWHALLDQKRATRQQEREEERQRQEVAEAERKRQREERGKQAEERRLERIAQEERRAQEIRRQEQEEQQAKVAAERVHRQNELRWAAEIAIKDEVRCELWLTTGNPRLRSTINAVAPRPIEFAATSNEALEITLRLLRSTKF